MTPVQRKGVSSMKAWSAMDYNAQCGYIVFAETRGKARLLAMREPGLDSSEWVDIDVKRMPDFDGKREKPCALDWQIDARLYYEACWWPDFGAPECEGCGRYEYPSIPESSVTDTEEGAYCVACNSGEQANE